MTKCGVIVVYGIPYMYYPCTNNGARFSTHILGSLLGGSHKGKDTWFEYVPYPFANVCEKWNFYGYFCASCVSNCILYSVLTFFVPFTKCT